MGKRVIVIGAGASGLLCAATAAERGHFVVLLEKMDRPARKLRITGKGRCNLTNNSDLDELISAVCRNGRFLYSAFSNFTSADTMKFFESLGVPLKVERGGRVFPQSDKAQDVVDALVAHAKKCGVNFLKVAAKKILISQNRQVSGVALADGTELYCDSVVLATGGKSYPGTGSTGDGYQMAKELGHSITPLSPSLVPLTVREDWCATASGLSLKNVSLKILKEGAKKPVYTDFGEMLFTHFGISGPMVLSASAHLENPEKVQYTAIVDLKPALSHEQLDRRILRDFEAAKNKDFSNALSGLLPAKLIPVVINLCQISPTKKVNSITKEQRAALCRVLKEIPLHITGFRPIEEAVVTRGGVDVREVNPATMESKLIGGLYFAGEILDVDAYTGGFNLQIAFSTGYLAGKSI